MALSSVPQWIPEDDLVLKNAVEAGASLEALAKGAVRFSRKFSVGELRDRWHSLLYDPDISSKASNRMVELELSNSLVSSKPNKSANIEVPTKRKLKDIRNLYYATRKKVCRMPCNSAGPIFLPTLNYDKCNGNGVDGEKCSILANELPVGNGVSRDCVLNPFGLQEGGIDLSHHVYSHTSRDIAPDKAVDVTCGALQIVDPDSREGNHLKVGSSKDAIIELPEKVPSMLAKESGEDGSVHHLENDEHLNVQLILQDNQVDFRIHPTALEIIPPIALPDSTVSFHAVGVSSPLHGSPLWKTIEDISAPDMPMSDSLEDKGHDAEGTLILHDDVDGRDISSSGYDAVQGEAVSKGRNICEEINVSGAISERDADISDSLLNFPNEDELIFMDVDEKGSTNVDMRDTTNAGKEGKMDAILCSPNDGSEDNAHVQESKTLTSDKCRTFTNLEAITTSSNTPIEDHICSSEYNVPSSTSLPNSYSHDFDDPMYCTLNTEDPEIPYNDDIVSPEASASCVTQPSYREAVHRASSSLSQMDSKHELNLVNKDEHLERSFLASMMVGSEKLLVTSLNPRTGTCGKSESSDGVVSRSVTDVHRESLKCKSVNIGRDSVADGSVPACNSIELTFLPEVGFLRKNILEPEVDRSSSDQEHYESDDDIPHFSDIEAMILDMDLCPDDDDPCSSKEVLRYQNDNSKRTIIRLEQCARSSMQRAISSQGALAILYGRHIKHYIKKTEVILGRATDDIDVDIDLGREGRANKISRRQAVIKMKEDGSFTLKNVGKSLILLNGREIAKGQLMSLSSSNLIEIKDMAFVFEVNHKSVRQFLAKSRKGQENTKFEWLDERSP